MCPRSISFSGALIVHLVSSKSRLAPIKRTAIPRFELLGNTTLAWIVFSYFFQKIRDNANSQSGFKVKAKIIWWKF